MTRLNRRNVFKMLGAAAGAGLAAPALAKSQDNGRSQGHRRFVLIHGAWHASFAWDGVAKRLRAAGHDVDAPTLPGMNPGDDRLGIQFGDYVDAVADMLRQQNKPVILVGHSSAGMLLQAAAPKVPDAVDMVVFSNAFVVANGQSQLHNIPADAAAALTALSQTTNDGSIPVEPLDGFFRAALMEGDLAQTQ